MYLKVGQSLACRTDTTTVLIIKAAEVDVSLTCGGVEMADSRSVGDRVPIADGATAAVELGKRYIDESGAFEVLCIAAGEGALEIDGVPLILKSTKVLPSSD
jgi:hypothetical protein